MFPNSTLRCSAHSKTPAPFASFQPPVAAMSSRPSRSWSIATAPQPQPPRLTLASVAISANVPSPWLR